MTYAAPWGGTGVPAGTHPGAPMVTTWQPTWVPAVVLGMERGTLASLLTVVLVVGFVGGCMGVGSSQVASAIVSAFGGADARGPAVSSPAPRVDVEPGGRVGAPSVPTPLPAADDGPRLPDLPPSRGARARVVRPEQEPIPAARAPFEVEASDVRDPWADSP